MPAFLCVQGRKGGQGDDVPGASDRANPVRLRARGGRETGI
ncbi:hypothetical protein AALB53_04035 [Lachnospiraceae bacterium 47-T17]